MLRCVLRDLFIMRKIAALYEKAKLIVTKQVRVISMQMLKGPVLIFSVLHLSV